MKQFEQAYQDGVFAHRLGHADISPFGLGSLMEMCAWSAGYFDAKRGMV